MYKIQSVKVSSFLDETPYLSNLFDTNKVVFEVSDVVVSSIFKVVASLVELLMLPTVVGWMSLANTVEFTTSLMNVPLVVSCEEQKTVFNNSRSKNIDMHFLGSNKSKENMIKSLVSSRRCRKFGNFRFSCDN